MEQSESPGFTDRASEIVREAPLLVSCFWCGSCTFMKPF